MPAIALMPNFPTASARLAPAAQRLMAELAQALAAPQLAGFRFRLEGHTDAVNSRPFNQILSERRPDEVRNHLITVHSVPAAKLKILGLGEQQLSVPTSDETPEARSRRVQMPNLGPLNLQ